MSPFRLLWKELLHRRVNAGLTVLSISVATAFVTAALLLVQGYQTQLANRVNALDDEIRKITKNMGFNINILPKDQNLFDLHSDGFGLQTMPYEFVQRLADSKEIVTINHLRPALVRKFDWPEYRRQIILIGVTGVIPWTHRAGPEKKPLAEALEPGTIHLGNVLADQIAAQVGGQVTLAGKTLRVATIHQPRGTQDDITAWVELPFLQELLQLPDQINMIQALECNCASQERLAEIETEISKVLDDEVQVIELSTKAIARARARVDVERSGKQQLQAIQTGSVFASGLSSLAACLIVGMLCWQNASQRSQEIGILRAIGTPTSRVLQLLLGKSALLGLCGAVLGLVAGTMLATTIARSLPERFANASLSPAWSVSLVGATIALALIASWLPALIVLGQDPARVVHKD